MIFEEEEEEVQEEEERLRDARGIPFYSPFRMRMSARRHMGPRPLFATPVNADEKIQEVCRRVDARGGCVVLTELGLAFLRGRDFGLLFFSKGLAPIADCIHYLDLGRSNVDDDAVAGLDPIIPRLKHFSLEETHVSDITAERLATHCATQGNTLRQLTMFGCQKLTSKAGRHFASSLRSRHCRLFTLLLPHFFPEAPQWAEAVQSSFRLLSVQPNVAGDWQDRNLEADTLCTRAVLATAWAGGQDGRQPAAPREIYLLIARYLLSTRGDEEWVKR